MAQVSYGTITITDTNDIERIYMVYAGSSSDTTAPDKTNFNLWKADITQVSGDYIWQRTVIKKSGIDITSSNFQNYYGDPVCITGPEGAEGAAARKITSVTPYYYLSTSNSTQTGGSWSTTPAAYPASGTYYYWTKTVTAYDSGNPSESSPVLDRALNSANETARSANSTAAAANSTANQANTTAGEAKTIAEGASSAISDLNQYFWRQKTAVTNVPAGSYVTNVPGTTYKNNPASGGFNSLVQASGIFLRNGITTLSSWTGDALIFYNPSTNSKAIELGTKNNVSTLSFYNPSNESISMMDLTSAGLVFKTSAGAEIGKFGSDSSGGLLELSGRLNIKGGGRIGQDSDNYWEFGDNRSYDSNDSAYLIGKGTASLQLGETGHWRLDKNRIHTGWYQLNDKTADTPAGSLHFDIGTESGINYYWDYGMHYPDKAGGGNNKFLYIRRSNDSTSTALGTMKSRIDDDSWWTYKFYVDGDGNLHAGDVYSHGTLISGTSAPYLLKSGGTITGNLEVNGNLTKGGKNVAYLTATPTSGQILITDGTSGGIKTSGYTIATSVPSGAIFTDQNVKTDLASNSTTFYIAGPTSTATTTGTLKVITDAKVTIDGSGKATITATTFSGNLSGTATKANQDGDGNVIKSTYLKLSGGNVTGAVSFGSSVSMDEATIGDLVVNGSASFTNNLQANTINGVAVGSSPKFTDTVTTVTTSGNGNAVTAITASNGKLTVTKGSTFLTSYTETDPVFVASVAHGITSEDISNWNSKTSNTGTVTSVRVQASSPLQSSVSTAQNASLNTTISFTNQNVNTVLAGPASGSTAAAPTFRTLVAADIPDISGTYYLASNPSGYTTNTGTVTSVKVQGSNGLTGSGTVTTSGTITLSHSDTSSQASSSNSGRTYIQSITLDTYGHVTGLSTATETVTNTHNTAYLYAGASNGSANAETTNGNTYLILVDGGSVTTRRKISGSGAATVTSDSSGNIAINAPTSLTGVSFDSGTITFSKSDGTTVPITTSDFVITQASGATALVRLKSGTTDEYEGYAAGGATTKPVYFDSNGHPVAVTSIPYSLLSDAPSSMTPKSHTHGNIQNSGTLQTNDITIANNDQLIVTDASDSNKIARTSIKFDGSTTTKALTQKGTWETFNNYSLPLAANGTRGGVQIGYTQSGKNYPVQLSSEKMYVNVPWTDTTYSAGTGLSLTGTTFANTGVTGVKGNSESSYRTGQVNLTPANLGAVRGNSYLFYGTCDTEAATAEKEVTCTGFTSNDLQPGAVINVYFTVTNSAAVANLQLNVNGTGAKPIRYIYNGSYSNIPGAGYIKLNQVYQFTYDGTYWIVQMIYNTDADWRVKSDYGRYTAGTSGLLPYALVMQASDGRWESITTTSTTAKTKAKNTTGFLLDSIFYRPSSSTVAEGAIDSTWTMYSCNVCDARYHFNIENTTALKLNNGNAIYLVGTIGSDGLFYLDDTWWAQSLPTTADGKYYVYLGTVYSWYQYNLDVFHPVYKFINGKVRNVSLDAISVNGHTINSDVPSNAKFTDTWNALSTSQAGYVIKAPNDTGKFLRGDATWAAVTKANVGLGNVENTALSTWTGTNKITTVGTITTGTWNGSAIPITHGGTGQTTAAKAIDALLNGLPTWTANPTDSTYFIRQDTGGSATYGKAQFSTLWNYISGKISSSGTYVTIATDQTITASQKTFNGAIRWGTASKYGAIHYDTALDALVFSFT